ncbi:hypothetical protein A1OE_628 [Candidatus Endolissoclinum faulkneri L2]|uniref:Uncharacterized protein n=1 Tax=Candidatus Endolissoclinum faulkneri L2 TaxID=1193729 RepID=K7ZCQ8_9PROT|nr:hypothetical protein A1OE_628 [Candidatus Endolissoclinum faulkneri L2]
MNYIISVSRMFKILKSLLSQSKVYQAMISENQIQCTDIFNI